MASLGATLSAGQKGSSIAGRWRALSHLNVMRLETILLSRPRISQAKLEAQPPPR